MPETLKSHFRKERFAREYLLDLNGTRAAVAAGFSANTAAQAASRMLRNVKVRALLKQLIGRFIAPPNLRAKHQQGIPDG
jgi:Terminase small subunit